MSKIHVNITTKVNSQQIRREQHNGRAHWVVPSYSLPGGVVMNRILYPASEIDAHFDKLEGTLAPLGHPTMDGAFVSAFSAEGINVGHVGAWNRNVKKSGSRVYLEKWIDTEVAGQTEKGKRLLERLEALEKGEDVPPIHTSVAVFLDAIPANEQQRKGGYDSIAKIHGFDHDAILLDQPGAATPEQGVGMMVNADTAQPLEVNSGALIGESYRERERRLESAAKARFVMVPDDYVWIADFTDEQAIVMRNGGVAEVYGYRTENGKIVFDDAGTAVVRQESWITAVVNSAATLMSKFFNPQARPAMQQEGDMPLTPEEKAELTKDISQAIAANLAEQLKPVTDKVDALQANQKALSESLTANAKAEEAEKRKAVAAKFGEPVANSLSGEALDAMFKQVGTAAALGAGAVGDDQQDFSQVIKA